MSGEDPPYQFQSKFHISINILHNQRSVTTSNTPNKSCAQSRSPCTQSRSPVLNLEKLTTLHVRVLKATYVLILNVVLLFCN
jgi:hypothetical protein